MDSILKIYDVKWTSNTAGPSPDSNRRTEIFIRGCKKAAEGNPCKGCFNPKLWNDTDTAIGRPPREIAEMVDEHAPNKFVTIVGGEPLDQVRPLAELVSWLKFYGFHIILFTHYTLEEIKIATVADEEYGDDYLALFQNVDVLVDGEYDASQRIYDDEAGDGLHDAIGSANQVVWDIRGWRKGDSGTIDGLRAGDLAGLYICPDGSICYITKTEDASFLTEELVA